MDQHNRATRGPRKIQLDQTGINEGLSRRGNQSSLSNLSHAFQPRNRHRERYMDDTQEVGIAGFEDRAIAYVDPLKREWWIVSGWYWVSSALLMSWVYRWMIGRKLVR